MDPDTTRALAKAAEETAKTAGKGLDIIHDTGGYLTRVLADVPTDLLGVSGGDWLHEVRIRTVISGADARNRSCERGTYRR